MLAHVPTWVYGLFALLLALGLLFTRPRAVHPVVPSLMAVGFGCYVSVRRTPLAEFSVVAYASRRRSER